MSTASTASTAKPTYNSSPGSQSTTPTQQSFDNGMARFLGTAPSTSSDVLTSSAVVQNHAFGRINTRKAGSNEALPSNELIASLDETCGEVFDQESDA